MCGIFVVFVCAFLGDYLTNVAAAKGFKIYRYPECGDSKTCPPNATKIIQVIAKEPNKTLHFILPGDNPVAPLSVLMLEADVSSDKLTIDWPGFLNRTGGIFNTIALDGVRTSYGFILTEFCVYVDVNDTAQITPYDIRKLCSHLLGKNLIWKLSISGNESNPLKFIYTALDSTDSLHIMGNITVSILFPRNEDELSQVGGLHLLPKMGLFFEITIDGVKVPYHGRIAPIIIPFSQDPVHQSEDFLQTTSLTKDYKETLFNLHLGCRKTDPASKNRVNVRVSGHSPAYMQWETNCEVTTDGKSKRRVYTAERMHISKADAEKYRFSLPMAYYGLAFIQRTTPDVENITVGARLQALSFGTPHDGFYEATNFVKWRGILSMGEPRELPNPRAQVRLAVAIAMPLVLLTIMVSILTAFIYKRQKSNRIRGSHEPLLPREENTTVRYAIDLPCLRGRSCLGGRLCLNRIKPPSPELPCNAVNESENLDL